MEIKNIWAWMIGTLSAVPFVLATAADTTMKRRGAAAFLNDIPIVQNLSNGELIVIIVVFYLVYQQIKKKN